MDRIISVAKRTMKAVYSFFAPAVGLPVPQPFWFDEMLAEMDRDAGEDGARRNGGEDNVRH